MSCQPLEVFKQRLVGMSQKRSTPQWKTDLDVPYRFCSLESFVIDGDMDIHQDMNLSLSIAWPRPCSFAWLHASLAI